MNRYARGIIGGFVATIVLSVVMMMKSVAGIFPAFNIIHLLTALAHAKLGLPLTPVTGWTAHLLIGTVLWGVLYPFCYPALPGKRATSKAMVFATTAWVAMMFVLMPWAGKGWFGLHFGPVLPLLALALHWIWGIVMGITFASIGKLAPLKEIPPGRESEMASAQP